MSVAESITAVETAIEEVESEIKEAEQELKRPGIKKADKNYYRQGKGRLRQKEDRLREEKLLLLQRAPISTVPENEVVNSAAFVELNRKVEMIAEAVVKQDRATPPKTPSQFGADELARVRWERKVFTMNEEEHSAAILTPDEASKLMALETEHEVVAYMTPFLSTAYGCDQSSATVLVNSEEYKWINCSESSTKYNQKPDMFVCHKSIYEEREPFAVNDNDRAEALTKLRRGTDIFGQISNWSLRRFIYTVLEAKITIDNAALGASYKLWCSHLLWLVLFDKTSFWLLECVKGTLSSIVQCTCVTPGSQAHLHEFVLQDPLMKLLELACSKFKLQPETGGHLGSGAFGIVFKVHNQSGQELALKIVPEQDGYVVELETQARMIQSAHEKCPDLVVGVKEDGYVHFEGLGAALLLSEVGSHYSGLSKQKIIDSLHSLHRNCIVHGDARIDNVVCVNGKAKWIDFRNAYVGDIQNNPSAISKYHKDLSDSMESSQYFRHLYE